jgi:putative Holliday junction resolvase
VTPRGTLIGFDFGERRIGVAVGESSTRIASPIGCIDARANEERLRAIRRIVDEWHPVAFVVGRPRHDDGSEHATARLAEKFARRLQSNFHVPVAFVDETLTSAEAETQLRDSRVGARDPGATDALAAALILQSYLDAPEAHEHLAA